MALQLPINFNIDIKSKLTNVSPLIQIGNYESDEATPLNSFIYISTTQIPIDQYTNSLPILLNMPSIKESIDIESSRKYKISSVNLEITNMDYDNRKFSEIIGSRSLINTEARIYWASQSTSLLFNEKNILNQNDEDKSKAFAQVFTGIIRKYDINIDKVILTVEDYSQAVLHRDLPLPDNNLGTGDDIPDKYKNKNIPLVYGYVDSSPCVVRSKPVEQDWIYTTESIEIVADKNASSNIKNKLKIFANDTYVNIPDKLDIEHSQGSFESSEVIKDVFGYFQDAPQYTINNNVIKLEPTGSNDTTNPSPTHMNKLIGYDEPSISPQSYSPVNQISDHWTDKEIAYDFKGRSFYGTVRGDGNYGLENEFAGSLILEKNRTDWQGSSFIDNIGNVPFPDTDIIPNYSLLYNDTSGDDNHHERALLGVNIETGSIDTGGFDETQSILFCDVGFYVGNVYDYGKGNPKRVILRVGNDDEGDQDNASYFPINVRTDTHGSSNWNYVALARGWSKIETADKLLINCRLGDQGSYGWGRCGAKIKINDIKLFNYLLIKNIFSQDYYADVSGRFHLFGFNLPAWAIIEGILVDELNYDSNNIDLSEATNSYGGYNNVFDGWIHALTIKDKINSKDLIEQLSSSSPYIARFDNMGKFKFSVIPEHGGDIYNEDGSFVNSENHLIKEEDVINYTFSRTDVARVASKVELKYKWDYAREEFMESVVVNQNDLFNGEYKHSYYGLKDDDSESTMVIDDSRGKSIRNEDTAKKFAWWLLSWNCNAHLKLKIKLPLFYMNIEISDIVRLDNLFDGLKPYGISYTQNDIINGQIFYPTFQVVNTSKTLEFVEIEIIQLHALYTTDCPEGFDCAGVCGGDAEIDECGVCGGVGATAECGCDDIPEGYCDCDNNSYDCAGICGGDTQIDDCGICGGDNYFDENGLLPNGACNCDGAIDEGCGCDELPPDPCGNCPNEEGYKPDSCDECTEISPELVCGRFPNNCWEIGVCGDCASGNPDNPITNVQYCSEPESLNLDIYSVNFFGSPFFTSLIDLFELTQANNTPLSITLRPVELLSRDLKHGSLGIDGEHYNYWEYNIKNDWVLKFTENNNYLNSSLKIKNVEYKFAFTEPNYNLNIEIDELSEWQSFDNDNINHSDYSTVELFNYDDDFNQTIFRIKELISDGGSMDNEERSEEDNTLDPDRFPYSNFKFNLQVKVRFQIDSDSEDNYWFMNNVDEDGNSFWLQRNMLIPITINPSVDTPEGNIEDVVNLMAGDATGDGAVNILDIVAVVNHVTLLQELTGNTFINADINGDGVVDILDIVAIVNIIMAGAD